MSQFNVNLEYEIFFNKTKDKILKIAKNNSHENLLFDSVIYYCVESNEIFDYSILDDILDDSVSTFVEIKMKVLENWAIHEDDSLVDVLDSANFFKSFIMPRYKLARKERPKKVCSNFLNKDKDSSKLNLNDIFNLDSTANSLTYYLNDDHSTYSTHLLFELWSESSYNGEYDMGYNYLGEVGEDKDFHLVRTNDKG